jgi:transposase
MVRKVKNDYAVKFECVKLVIEKDYSCNYVSIEKGLERSNRRKWVGFYKKMEPLICYPERIKFIC